MKSDPKIQKLSLSAITVDMQIQPRAHGLNQNHVAEIEEAYRAGKTVEPPVVWRLTGDGKGYKLSQGFHRVEAARRAGLTHLECVVMAGTELKCVIDAMCSNQGHGLIRSPDDKRRCVAELIKNMPEGTSDRHIHDISGVSGSTIADVRKELRCMIHAPEFDAEPARRTGKDGKSYPMPKPKPAPAAEVAAGPDAPAEPVTLPAAAPTPAEQPFTGEVEDEPAEVAEPVAVPAKPDPLATLIDPLGQSIPRGVRDTFGDPAMRNAVERIRAAHAELVSIANHVKGPLARKGEYWPFSSCGKSAESLLNAADAAAVAMSQIESGLPYCVCTKCKGAKCPHCRNGGYLPKWKHEDRQQYGV